MARSIPALVTPEVLVWARNLDAISVDEIAAKLHIAPERIQEWENGTSQPTLKQAKDLAKQYRVPFVYFYLPDVPHKTKRLEHTDYRTFGNVGDQFNMSRELRWLLRDIEDRRDSMLNFYAEEKRIPCDFPFFVEQQMGNEDIAAFIRRILEITQEKQVKFRRPENFLTYCISILEKYDVLIFQAAKIDPHEMRGLSVAYDQMPIIVLNRKDEPAARLFTLIHELVHIVTKTSGICNDISGSARTKNQQELTCNEIAGMVLVSQAEIKEHEGIKGIKQYGFDDSYVMAMARDFAVSKEVVLHSLMELKLISESFYYETLKRYSSEYLASKAKQKKGFLPPTTDAGTQVGKLYARTVLNAYHNERISARDTSNYLLNLKAKNFEKLERWCF